MSKGKVLGRLLISTLLSLIIMFGIIQPAPASALTAPSTVVSVGTCTVKIGFSLYFTNQGYISARNSGCRYMSVQVLDYTCTVATTWSSIWNPYQYQTIYSPPLSKVAYFVVTRYMDLNNNVKDTILWRSGAVT